MSVRSRFFSRRTLLADRFLWCAPESLGGAVEDVAFPAPGGVTLRGWLLRGERPGLVVFAPGNSGNLSSHAEYLRLVRGSGRSVLGFDYRGFGRSDGEPDLGSVVGDVRAACAFAGEAIDPGGRLVLFGVSLGAGAALAAAAGLARRGRGSVAGVVAEGLAEVPEMLAGLFAEGAFGPRRVHTLVGPDGVARKREAPRWSAPRLPRVLAGPLARAAAALYPFAGRSPRRLASRLGGLPVLLVHGAEDALLPFEAAIDVRRLLPESADLWIVPRAGHAQEPILSHRAEYAAQLARFFERAFDDQPREEPVFAFVEQGTRAGGAAGRLELELSAPGAALVTATGGGTLWQGIARVGRKLVVELPGPIEVWWAIEASTLEDEGFPRTATDPRSREYREGGYRAVFRRLVAAVNRLRLDDLDLALEAYLRLERAAPYDVLASTYALRAAVAARGAAPGWRPPAQHGEAIARRSLERFLELWEAHPAAAPGAGRAGSPAAWARNELRREVPARVGAHAP